MNIRLSIVALVSILIVHDISGADTLVLKNGAKLQGEVKVKRNEKNAVSDYVVKLDSGIYVKLKASRVRHRVKKTEDEKSYEGLLASMPDTAASHWEMAEFCRKRRLTEQRAFHLQRTLTLDPNHAAARKADGYQWRDGQWTRQDDIMERRGYVRYGRRWLLPQQVEDLQRADALKKKLGESRKRILGLRKSLNKRGKREQAIEDLLTLNDPLAQQPLIEVFYDDESPENREVYLTSLARYDGSAITRELVHIALHDKDQGVLTLAVEQILKRPEKAYATSLLLPYLNSTSNWKVNQAALILGRLGERDAILPLIGSLITTHKRKIVPPGGDISTSFGNGPNGGGMSFNAGNRTKIVSEDKQNTHVLKALARITGENFGYSEYDWREWYKQQQAPDSVSLRRDF